MKRVRTLTRDHILQGDDLLENLSCGKSGRGFDGGNCGFGSFGTKTRAAKVARNITKNESILVPEHKIPSFKPADSFAEILK